MSDYTWITEHWIEIFGAVTGIIYVFLEIRKSIWLWPVGIVTSMIYVSVFFTSKFYADMSLQFYYILISFYGFYVWRFGTGIRKNGEAMVPPAEKIKPPDVTRTPIDIVWWLVGIYIVLHAAMWYTLAHFTDSPVAFWDSFTTALSVIATWMLARKYIEHWILWVIVNIVSMILYIYKGLYPTTILFLVYTVMAMVGYREWLRDIKVPCKS